MTLPRTPRAVVFDMDGLLFDTEAVARDTFFEASTLHGRDVPMSVYARLIGTSGQVGREILIEHFGPNFDTNSFWDSWGVRYDSRLQAGVALKSGVMELLDRLDTLKLRRAIATSSPHEYVRQHLDHHGLQGRFDAVVAAGDYERGKPSPDPFLKAAQALGVPPRDCLALEDSHHGVRAAHAAGMMAVMVPDLLDPTEEMRGLCVRIASSLHEVDALIALTLALPA